jgi:hypothetical protein
MDLYAVEHINSIEASSIHKHIPQMKKGCILFMCLMNVGKLMRCCTGAIPLMNTVLINILLSYTINYH